MNYDIFKKLCPTCGEIKTLDGFRFSDKTGYENECRRCVKGRKKK